MVKITIIGAGSVGSTIAYTLAVQGTASEILMIDVNEDKAEGEAMDIKQGTPFCPSPVNISAGTYQDARGSDIVIITSGVGRKPGQTRLDLTRTNVDILKNVASEIVKYAPSAIYLIVSNPVDILTYVFCKISGVPLHHIIGSGTILDTARLRERIAAYYDISKTNIHASVYGEHGDSSFVPWSVATISNVPIREYSARVTRYNSDGLHPVFSEEEVEGYIRKSGARIIERKGATNYAVAIAVCHICRALLSETTTSLAVSTMIHGDYGIDDVCLSTPTLVNRRGIVGRVRMMLTDEELEKLHHSADCLREVIDQLEL